MIGQKDLQRKIELLIQNGFPRFTVITGQKGQGKKYVAKQIANKLKYLLVEVTDLKIDNIRKIIDLSYKHTEPIIYLLADADNLSIGAKNSLLKVIEEPPNNAYFMMTLRTIENTLDTIKSRCVELPMDNYIDEDINEFIKELASDRSETEKTILQDVCSNRYQIQLFLEYGVTDFYNYVEKVVNHIYKVQSANSFKLTEKIDLKNDGNGYDLELFFQLFINICMNNLINEIDTITDNFYYYKDYAKSIGATKYFLNKLKITGINKQSLIDMWILDIRQIWRSE